MSGRLADLAIVTGASSNHFGPLQLMLASLRRLNARVWCYDLGLTEREFARLHRWEGLTLRRFDYAAHPPHMNIEVNAGEYAWKPVIVGEVIDEQRARPAASDVLWVDAGCYFHSLDGIRQRIAGSGGLYVRTSAGDVARYTHPGMFAYFGEEMAPYAALPNADATLIGFAIGSAPPEQAEAVYDQVLMPWRRCAMTRQCIAPDGSSRKNHRQDQAVLTYLVHKVGYPFATDTWRDLGVRCKCDRFFYHYVKFKVPAALYARLCMS